MYDAAPGLHFGQFPLQYHRPLADQTRCGCVCTHTSQESVHTQAQPGHRVHEPNALAGLGSCRGTNDVPSLFNVHSEGHEVLRFGLPDFASTEMVKGDVGILFGNSPFVRLTRVEKEIGNAHRNNDIAFNDLNHVEQVIIFRGKTCSEAVCPNGADVVARVLFHQRWVIVLQWLGYPIP